MGLKAVEKNQTDRQVSQAPLLIAQDQASRLGELHNLAMTTDPNDIASAMGKYSQENLSGAKEEYMANFTTPAAQKHAEALWTQHEAHLYNTAGAISVQAAADANHNNLVHGVNTFAANAGDHPEALDANLQFINGTIDSQLGNLPRGQRDAFDTTFRTEAQRNAVTSALKTVAFGSPDGSRAPNPALADSMIDSGKYDDLFAGHMQDLKGVVQVAHGLVKMDQQNNASSQAAIAQQQSNATSGQYLDQINHDPTTGAAVTPANFSLRVAHDDNIQPADKQALIGASQRLSTGAPPVTTAATMDHMLGRLASPTDRPTTAQIMTQVAQGNLSLADAKFLTAQSQQPPSPALQQLTSTLSDGKSALLSNRGSGLYNPAGAAAYQRFQEFAVNAYKNGEPIDQKAFPDIVDRFRPTGNDVVNSVPANARPDTVLSRGGRAAYSAPPTDAQLPLIAAFESSDRNVRNPEPTSSGNAEGHYQITTGTWKDFAPKAGVNLADYPNALRAPKNIQAAVAKVIPLSRWDPKTLAYLRSKGALG